MSILNGKQLQKELDWLPQTNNKEFFCGDCYKQLEKTKEGTYYCPNEMCLNEKIYSEEMEEVIE